MGNLRKSISIVPLFDTLFFANLTKEILLYIFIKEFSRYSKSEICNK
jgi:hypothetical protein